MKVIYHEASRKVRLDIPSVERFFLLRGPNRRRLPDVYVNFYYAVFSEKLFPGIRKTMYTFFLFYVIYYQISYRSWSRITIKQKVNS